MRRNAPSNCSRDLRRAPPVVEPHASCLTLAGCAAAPSAATLIATFAVTSPVFGSSTSSSGVVPSGGHAIATIPPLGDDACVGFDGWEDCGTLVAFGAAPFVASG